VSAIKLRKLAIVRQLLMVRFMEMNLDFIYLLHRKDGPWIR